MSAAPWMEYHLRALEFQNGAKIGFSGARMLYNEDDHIVAIERIGASQREIDYALAEAFAGDNQGDLKTIFYDMVVQQPDGPYTLRFYHAIQRGADVRLLRRDKGRSRIFFAQKSGAPMFSKDYTLRQVSEGAIPSDKSVWQFHGYKHEH